MGWGGSSPRLTSASLTFKVGSADEYIALEVGRPSRLPYAGLLIDLVAEVAGRATPRFPLVIERDKQRIRVASRNRVFTLLTAAHRAVATTRVGEFTLTIRCHRKRLARLALLEIEPDELCGLPQFRASGLG